jgi:cytochrome b561
MPKAHYHPISIFFHWLVLALLIAAFAAIELKGQFPKGSEPRELTKTIHGLLGQVIFIVMGLRLAARLVYGVPAPINHNTALTTLAKAMHCLFYILLLTLPILGVTFLQAGGKEVHFFGWTWPQLITPNKEMKHSIEGVHEFLGNSLYFLIAIHALAGLWQHYVMKDDTLRRMLYKVKART